MAVAQYEIAFLYGRFKVATQCNVQLAKLKNIVKSKSGIFICKLYVDLIFQCAAQAEIARLAQITVGFIQNQKSY